MHSHRVPDVVVAGVGPNGYQHVGKIFRDGKIILGKFDNNSSSIPIGKHEHVHVLSYTDSCQHHFNKCITNLSEEKCDCSDCYEVEPA